MINDQDWNANTFLPTVGKRGAAIIEARGLSSAASAANAAIDHMRDWALGTNGKWVTMGIPSDGQYGIPKDVMFGFPVTCENGEYKLVEGLAIDEFSQERIDKTLKELHGRTSRRRPPAVSQRPGMLDWNPALYSRYEDERTRPARELLARVPLAQAARVFDLGCGPGNSTELLVQRFPAAAVVGTDNSEPMLASARQRLPQARFELGDIATWAPEARARPHLCQCRPAMGARPRGPDPQAVRGAGTRGRAGDQMPDNRQEPTHRLMREVAAEAPGPRPSETPTGCAPNCWASRLLDLLARRGRGGRRLAHRLPASDGRRGGHRRMGQRHRAEAFRRPLARRAQTSYLAEYERRIARAYPARADGRLLLAFPRMFIVAQKEA